MKTVGIFGGAFKPFTKGHYSVVEKAAKENDVVILFVSQGDRLRKGQFPIYWKDMQKVWNDYLKNIMPSNVDILFVPNPISATMDLLNESVTRQHKGIKYRLYSDSEDMKGRYDNPRTRKNLSFLFDNGLLDLVPLPRLKGASGTKARKFLELGLVDEFSNELPEPIQKYGYEIFKQLGAKEV